MAKKCVLFTLIFLLFAGSVSAQAGSVTEGIVYITGQNIDARVKLRETPRGKIIGQYYSGTYYTADEEKDGWTHVTIGGRTGWMMSSYLQKIIPNAVNAPVGDQNYYGWLIPVDDLSFDPRLILPSMWTEG